MGDNWGHKGLPPGGREVLRYTDLMIQTEKADNRGVVIGAIRGVLEAARDQWRITEDPRYLELILRATDRLVRLLELSSPEVPVLDAATDPKVLVDRVRRDLVELEARMGEEPRL